MSETNQSDVSTPFCLGCDYQLTGANHFRCPECGRAFDPDDPASFRTGPKGKPDPNQKKAVDEPKSLLGWFVLIGLGLVIWFFVSRCESSPTNPGGPPPEEGGLSLWTIGLITVGVLVVLAVVLWIIASRWLMANQKRVEDLKEELRHEEVLLLQKRMCTSWHPGRWYMSLLFPGVKELGVAVQLAHMGLDEEALSWLAEAEQMYRRRKRLRRLLERNVALLLESMGMYDDPRVLAACKSEELHSGDRRLDLRMLLLLDQGKLREAAQLAESEFDLASTPEQDMVRYGWSAALEHLGRFDEALKVVDIAPSGAWGDKPKAVGKGGGTGVESDSAIERRSRIRLQVRVMYKQREIEVHQVMGDQVKSAEAIEALVRLADLKPTMRITIAGYRAGDAALRGDAEACDKWLAECAAMENTLPLREKRAAFALMRGKCRVQLHQPEQAREDLTRCIELTRKPLQRHIARYWLAKAHEAADDMESARREYERVVADGTNSWMEKEAEAGITRCTSPHAPPR